ncbi:McrB family protein [Vibrio hibernica]|uniref:McrB family protein n=1 Tax=Vibrio hibernica TaxID=2587465 RepID=UPI0039B109DF
MTQPNPLQTLWDEFSTTWPLERIERMTLPQYVSTQDKTTFTYWVETKTQSLANIKGSPSSKFGIYKRGGSPKEQSGMAHGNKYSWWAKFGATEQEAFEQVRNEIVKVIKAAQVGDIKTINKASLAPVYKWKIAFLYQDQTSPSIVNIFAKDKLAELTGLPKSTSYPDLYDSLVKHFDKGEHTNIAEYGRVCWSRLSNEKTANGHERANDETSDSEGGTHMTPLNQILYGPPGTGKTYHSVEAAVKASEPQFYDSLNIDIERGSTPEQRKQLKIEYDRLVSEKRIRFVTFHQSYGYEEFVEGLAASSADGQISYEVKSGVFKDICEQASRGVEQSNDPLEIAIEKLKDELEGGVPLPLKTRRGKIFDVQYHGNTTFRVYPHESSHEDLGNGYPVSIDNIRKLYGGVEAKELYNPSYVSAILEHLIKNNDVPSEAIKPEKELKNFVLVIDEINRGNMSKIFGELITLIEESKRSGEKQTEALEVILPHSRQKFSVPQNLYIIGTMNTADRSLAMIDTALRRRFDFVEMMPKPELLHEVFVNDIDLEKLLRVLNQRIEILYDREHTLGHAFFMPVKALVEAGEQGEAFKALVSVLKNKIIPLLEEYFFEDWSKIRLVLADNQKTNASMQFVLEQAQKSDDLKTLFGKGHNLDQYGQSIVNYILADNKAVVWSDPQAYIGVYDPQAVKQPETEEVSQTESAKTDTDAQTEVEAE